MTRNIRFIVLHCTATPQTTTIESIKRYWKEVKGWKQVGYHYIIEPNGNITKLAKEDEITNGVAGYNKESIHISYIGGIDTKGKALDNRTNEQVKSMFDLILELVVKYPKAEIRGHRDFLKKGGPNHKDCPSFDVRSWIKSLGLS
jgi:N-acetyl-anhydromuramyl-L-alanine amidase AmpD